MIAIIPTPLADHDPLLLELLALATETMLAHPKALPADLSALLDMYAADLTDARTGDGRSGLEFRHRSIMPTATDNTRRAR